MFRKWIYVIQKNLDFKRGFDNNKDIIKDDLNSYIKQGAIIIDVRSPQEFREGIPDYQIKKEIERKIPNKNEIIIVYCSTGHRSQKSQKILERLGYKNVYNIYEGIII